MTTPAKEQDGAVAAKAMSGKRKWLKRIGTFLMMGVWLLVLILVVGIYIAISIWTH